MKERINSFTHELKSKDIYRISAALSYLFFIIFMVDCAFAGAGRIIEFGPIGFRMLIMGFIVLFSIPIVIKKFKEIIKNPMVIMLLGFLVILGIGAVRGYFAGNRMDVLASDIKGFMYFAILPCALCVIDTKEKLLTIIKAVVISSFALSITVLTMNVLFCISQDIFLAVYKPIKEIMFGTVHQVSATIFRIFPKSIPYIAVGSVFSIYLSLQDNVATKLKIFYSVVTSVTIWALVLSYTRSIFGAVGVSLVAFVVVWLIANKGKRVDMLKTIGVSVASFLVITFALSIPTNTNYIGFAVSRTVATLESKDTDNTDMSNRKSDGKTADDYISDTITSDNYRAETTRQLMEMIKVNPIFGNGLGAAIEQRENGLVENTYLDLINKIGIVGLVIYLLPVFYMMSKFFKWLIAKKSYVSVLIPIASAFLVFLLSSYFNPYMNAALGIAFYCYTIAAFTIANKIEREDKNTNI